MAVTDPYPGQPTDGQSLDAVPILAKFNALFQGIQSFDGSQIQAGTVAGSAMQTSVNPNTLLKETESTFVSTGLIWSSVSGLQGTMSSGIAYIANASATFRVSVTGVGSYTFTASKDTYIDIDYNGNIYYQAVANGATAPALTVNSVRVAKIITGASAITSVLQAAPNSGVNYYGGDGIGNVIYPSSPGSALQLQYAFSAYRSAPLTPTTDIVIPMDTKLYDFGNNYSTTTGLFTAPIPGIYFFSGQVFGGPASTTYYIAAGQKNGSLYRYGPGWNLTGSNDQTGFFSAVPLATGDTFGLAVHSGSNIALNPGNTNTYLDGFLLSRI